MTVFAASAKLHNAAFCKVAASRYATAPRGVAHRWRALSGLQNRRYAKLPTLERSHSRRRSPVAFALYAPPTARPCGCRGTVAPFRRFARCSGQWPAASHYVCAPAHPPGPRRCAALALRAGCPSAPGGGSLSTARAPCLRRIKNWGDKHLKPWHNESLRVRKPTKGTL